MAGSTPVGGVSQDLIVVGPGERRTSSGGGHSCPICSRTFTQKKTLYRHTRTVHQLGQQRQFVCRYCDLSLKREDVLRRHESNQHDGGATQTCDICGKRVRPRYLPQHWRSAACRKASAQADAARLQVVKAARSSGHDSDIGVVEVPDCLPAILDVMLASAWLLVKTRPWGRENAAAWAMEPLGIGPTDEALELKGLMYRAMGRALRHFEPSRDTTVIDALLVFLIVSSWLDGFEATMYHTKMAVHFEYQSLISLGARRPYLDKLIREIFTTVLSREVNLAKVPQCLTVAILALQLMRESALYEIRMAHSAEPDVSGLTREEYHGRYAARLARHASLASVIEID